MSGSRLEDKSIGEQKSIDFSDNEKYQISIDGNDLRCPITFQIFYDPVLVYPCSHSFERDEIEKLKICPICRCEIRGLLIDKRAKDIIAELTDKNPTLTNECYFSIDHLSKVLSSKAVIPTLLLKILRYSTHLNAISDSKGYRGSSALTELAAYASGLELLIKDVLIQKNITTEGLNAILLEGDYKGTSALYWLANNNSTLIKSLTDKITTEALNCPKALGKHQGYSPLHWLCNYHDGLKILLENSELRSKISVQGLSNCVQSGSSPLYYLCGSYPGQQLLIEDEKLRNKISSEALNQLAIFKDEKIINDSALSQLIYVNGGGIDLLLNDPILRSKITPETLNSIYERQNINFHYSTLLLLAQNSKGLKLLIRDDALTDKITEKGLNFIASDGSSVLYELTNSDEGIELLAKNPRLCEKILTVALKRGFKNPLLNLVQSTLGRELLFKSKCLRQKITSNVSSKNTLGTEEKSTYRAYRILSETELGKKILRQLFNTPDQISRLCLYSVIADNAKDFINILTPEFIREIINDEKKIIVFIKILRLEDTVIFLDQVYNYRVSLFEYKDLSESDIIQRIQDKVPEILNNSQKLGVSADKLENSFPPIFDVNNEKVSRSGSLSYAYLSIFSCLNDNELSITARVSKRFKQLSYISRTTRNGFFQNLWI